VSNGITPDQIKLDFSKMLFLPVVDTYILVDIDAPPPIMEFALKKDLNAQAPDKRKRFYMADQI
jgi:hypothetical protein